MSISDFHSQFKSLNYNQSRLPKSFVADFLLHRAWDVVHDGSIILSICMHSIWLMFQVRQRYTLFYYSRFPAYLCKRQPTFSWIQWSFHCLITLHFKSCCCSILPEKNFPALWPLLTSHSSLLLCWVSDNACFSTPVRTPRLRWLTFLSYICRIYTEAV